MTVTVTIRLSEEDKKLFKSHAAAKKMSLSELLRTAVMEQIEDELDIQEYYEAMKTNEQNPVTYTHEEVFGKTRSIV